MIVRSLVFALAAVLAVSVARAQTASMNAEQVETGVARVPSPSISGPAAPMRSYRIRLLPVSSFPQLPSEVSRELAAMGCMVPQTYEARGPENVISGAFEKPGSEDWAVLCSVRGVTTLYVFFQSDLDHPAALRHQPDSEWLGRDGAWAQDYGSAWGIETHPLRVMRAADRADHDGIEDAFVEQSSTVHYYRDGQWTVLDGNP